MSAEPTVEVRDLNKIYGSGERSVHAVRDATFSAHAGEFLAIVGPVGPGRPHCLQCWAAC